jgi:hypothetical protein
MQRVALLRILLVPVFAQSHQSAVKAPWDSFEFFVGRRVGPQQQFIDSDRDGLNGELAQSLLEKVRPDLPDWSPGGCPIRTLHQSSPRLVSGSHRLGAGVP